MEQFTVRDLRRNAATRIAAIVKSGGIVKVVEQGFIVSASNPVVSWLETLDTNEPAHSLSRFFTKAKKGDDKRVVVPSRMSQSHPIPIRFGTSAEVKAWMVPLSWGPRLGL